MNWYFIEDGKYGPSENMDKDMALFEACDFPTARFYGWKDDCITLGYSQDLFDEIDVAGSSAMGIDLSKRPTGGGLVFHSKDDFTFSFVFSVDRSSNAFRSAYESTSRIVKTVLKKIGIEPDAGASWIVGPEEANGNICFSRAMSHEITVSGKKIAGIAQKSTRDRVLQQGTISVSRADDRLFKVLSKPFDVHKYSQRSICIQEITGEKASLKEISLLFKQSMV